MRNPLDNYDIRAGRGSFFDCSFEVTAMGTRKSLEFQLMFYYRMRVFGSRSIYTLVCA